MRKSLFLCGLISFLLTSCSTGINIKNLSSENSSQNSLVQNKKNDTQINKSKIEMIEVKQYDNLILQPPIEVQRGVNIESKIEKELLKQKEEHLKPVSGLFKTSLESFNEDGKLTLNFSLQNVSEEDQQIIFGSVSRIS